MTQASGAAASEPLLIFLHNMRTGGVTLRTLVRRQYAADEVVTLGKRERCSFKSRELELVNAPATRVVQGHIPFGLHAQIERPAEYVTMLRQPLDRVISLYYHLVEDTRNALRDRLGAHLATLHDFVSGSRLHEIDNGQTRRISGRNPEFGECSREMLEEAKDNLRKHFSLVSLTGRYAESLILMRRLFGWKYLLYSKMNDTRTKPKPADIEPATIELITRYNELDLELYRYTEQLFDQAVARQPAEFRVELAALTALQAELSGQTVPSRTGQGPGQGCSAGAEQGSPLDRERCMRAMLLDTSAYFLAEEQSWRAKALRSKDERARLRAEIEALRRQSPQASTELPPSGGKRNQASEPARVTSR